MLVPMFSNVLREWNMEGGLISKGKKVACSNVPDFAIEHRLAGLLGHLYFTLKQNPDALIGDIQKYRENFG